MPLPPPINVGLVANDGKGDPLRTAHQKANARDEYLDQRITSVSTPTMVAGPVTTLPPGSPATASVSGTAPNFTLDLGLPTGASGAGAPTSADILALADRDDLMREIAGAGVPDRPIAILDFVRGAHWIKGVYAGASILALVAALPGSSFSRASTATYFDSDGLMKTAAANVPRIEYDPVTRICRGYLREPARTNLLLRSEEFDHAYWTKTRASILSNAATAPDGLTTADKLVEDTSSGTHIVTRNLAAAASTTHTFPVFLQAAGRTEAFLQLWNGGGSYTAFVDLVAGTIVQQSAAGGDWSAGAVSIQPCGGGCFRASITANIGATPNVNVVVGCRLAGSNSYTGDGASGLYLWGAQLEEGSAPSSYIPTAASTVTRAVDNMNIIASSWINLPEGTIFAEFEAIAPASGNERAVNLGTETLSDFIRTYRAADGRGYVRSMSGGVTTISAQANMNWPATPAARSAVGWKVNDAAWAWEGAIAGSSSTYVAPLSMQNLNLADANAINPVVIKRILIYPRRLSNAKLQALTNQSLWS